MTTPIPEGATQSADYDAALGVLRAAHPVSQTRRCGNRLAEPVDPPPGPPAPPIWCNRAANHDGECVTYDGRRLSGFVRAGLGIEERPPVVSYRCETCRTQQEHRSPDPCDTLRLLTRVLPPASTDSGVK